MRTGFGLQEGRFITASCACGTQRLRATWATRWVTGLQSVHNQTTVFGVQLFPSAAHGVVAGTRSLRKVSTTELHGRTKRRPASRRHSDAAQALERTETRRGFRQHSAMQPCFSDRFLRSQTDVSSVVCCDTVNRSKGTCSKFARELYRRQSSRPLPHRRYGYQVNSARSFRGTHDAWSAEQRRGFAVQCPNQSPDRRSVSADKH